MLFKPGNNALNLVLFPNVILVRQEYYVAFAEIDGLLKVCANTKISGVFMDVNYDRACFSYRFQYIDGLIGRSIVANHDLVHRMRLAEY